MLSGMLTVSYERISEDKTGQAAGVERQHQDNTLLARAKGQKIERRYVDNDISALDETKTRPEFERLVSDVKAGRVSMIIVWHLDRLAVRVSDLARLLAAAKPHQVTIAAVHGVSIDLSDPTGVAVATILVAIAEMERRHKGIRQGAANRQRAENGRVGWSRRPFGYARDENGRIVVVEHEAAEFVHMVRRALDGWTLASIVADLNERGVRNSIGGRWSVTPLRRLLLNPRHAARAVSNGKDYGPGDWKPIIDEATHERLIHLLRDPRRQTAPSTRTKHLLSGLIWCGRCGERMFASPYQPKHGQPYMIYRCAAGKGHLVRKMAPVDHIVTEVILARLERPDAAALFAPDVDLDRLRNRAVDLRDRRDGIAAMLADGLISREAADRAARGLTAELVGVEREIESATGTGPLSPLASAEDIRAEWDRLDLAGKRAIIDTLVSITMLPAGKGVKLPDPEGLDLDDPQMLDLIESLLRVEWKTG